MLPYFEIPPLKLGPIELHSFGAFVALGFIVGSSVATWRAKKVGQNPQVMHDLALLCIIFGMLGAHLFDVFASRPHVILKDPWEIFRVWSGISSYGGFIGAGVAIWVYFKKKKIPFLPYADTLMYGMGPGWVFGRMGCCSVHDHPGRLTDFFLALKYPGGPRHDLGCYEVLLTLGLTLMIFWMGRKNDLKHPRPGTIYAVTLMAYSMPRFFMDFLRATDLARIDPRYFGLTPSQYASIVVFSIGVWVLMGIRKRPIEA